MNSLANRIRWSALLLFGLARQLAASEEKPYSVIPLPTAEGRRMGVAEKVAMSPDGKLIAGGSTTTPGGGSIKQAPSPEPDNAIKLWDAAKGGAPTILEGHTDLVDSLAFAPDGKTLATAGGQEIIVWDLSTFKRKETFKFTDWLPAPPKPEVKPKIESETNPEAGEAEPPPIGNGGGQRRGQGFGGGGSGDFGARGGLGGGGGSDRKPNPPKVVHLAFAPDSKTLYSITSQGEIKHWGANEKQKWSGFKLKDRGISCAALSLNGKFLAVADFRGLVSIWDIRTDTEANFFPVDKKAARSLAFNSDGTKLVTTGSEQSIKVWDVASGKEKLSIASGDYGAVFSPDDRRIASANSDSGTLWNAETGQCQAVLTKKLSGPPTTSIFFTPDGKHVACGMGILLRLWPVQFGQSDVQAN